MVKRKEVDLMDSCTYQCNMSNYAFFFLGLNGECFVDSKNFSKKKLFNFDIPDLCSTIYLFMYYEVINYAVFFLRSG